jgi:hypothetical protein
MLTSSRSHARDLVHAAAAVALTVVGTAWVAGGCAEGIVEFDPDGTTSSTSGVGGQTSSGGGVGGTASGTGGSTSPCAVDCSQIQAPDCQLAQCNVQTGQCEVVADSDGTTCDDGVFCTVDDGCVAGVCEPGPQNDCGLAPAACETISCDETSQTCSTVASQNGDPCVDPNDLCLEAATCLNGLCSGTAKDCFFSPVPDDCHVSECNPQTGNCEPVVGNEGGACTDAGDLCTVNKTCASGVCQGGNPKDCSQLTQDCVLGVCDVNTGQCTTQSLNNGDPCDDLNACTSGEICQNSSCAGGTPIIQCVGGDQCCPSNCTQQSDADCSCNVNLATGATAAVNPGGGTTSPYTADKMNNLVGENCSEWAWLGNSQSSPGWASLIWNGAQTVGSMFIDSEHATSPACGSSGRDIASADVQYRDTNSNWVTVGTISGAENYMYTFPAPVLATGVRINNVLSSSGNGNTVVHEWYVWPGVGCATPTPN